MMTETMSKAVSLDAVETYVEEGLVSARPHPHLPLRILNYTPKTQFERAWDSFTLAARGLVIDNDGQIIARPLPKFFNVGEVEVPDLPFVAYDKLDGSLIIGFMYDGEFVVATRGSFESEQAKLANHLLLKASKPENRHIKWVGEGHTYLFELIHPKNRIVVDYGNREDLVHLATIDTFSGEELDIETPFPRPEMWVPRSIDDLPHRTNAEGFVLRFTDGTRLKMKYDEYVQYHRVIFGLNDARVVEMIEDETLETFIDGIPDELHGDINATAEKAEELYGMYYDEARADFYNIDADSRKEFALKAFDSKYMDILFGFYDEKWDRVENAIWKRVKTHLKDGYFVES